MVEIYSIPPRRSSCMKVRIFIGGETEARDSKVAGPQTLAEKCWDHVFPETLTGTGRKGPYVHEVPRLHWGKAADCKKCKKEGRLPSVSKDQLSAMAWQNIRRVTKFFVIIIAIAVAAMKLSAQAPAPVQHDDTGMVVMLFIGFAVTAVALLAWMLYTSIRPRDKEENRTVEVTIGEHGAVAGTTGERGVEFLEARRNHGFHPSRVITPTPAVAATDVKWPVTQSKP